MRHPHYILIFLLATGTSYGQAKKDSIAMQHLGEVKVSSSKVQRVLHSSTEYVVDYDIVDNQLLVASYSGANGNKPKLFLLNKEGDTLTMMKPGTEPVAIFKSCTGNYYYVSGDKFFLVSFSGGDIRFEKQNDISILEVLKYCQLKVSDNFYYKVRNEEYFNTTFSLLNLQDSVFKQFFVLNDQGNAKASMEEFFHILKTLEFGNRKEAFYIATTREAYNKWALAKLDPPIFEHGKRVVIFDFYNKRIRQFDLAGNAIKDVSMQFTSKNVQRLEIIKDHGTNKFYLHRSDNNITHTLQELNIETGAVVNQVVEIEKPFAVKVKIHNGEIYYLWQNSANRSTQQLYVQKN
jgi:hypothetical protein